MMESRRKGGVEGEEAIKRRDGKNDDEEGDSTENEVGKGRERVNGESWRRG